MWRASQASSLYKFFLTLKSIKIKFLFYFIILYNYYIFKFESCKHYYLFNGCIRCSRRDAEHLIRHHITQAKK